MENISRTLSILKKARYLQANLEKSNIDSLELLSLGKKLRTQIERHWQLSQMQPTTTAQISEPYVKEVCEYETYVKDIDPRLQFIYTKIFRDNMQLLKPSNNKISNLLPLKMKIYDRKAKFKVSDALKFKTDESMGSTQLVTDQFFNESCGLANLYKLQRERKIWWMRFSSDPSRYYLEPYKFSNNSMVSNAQSITIKSHLGIGHLSVEHITLVPLTDYELEHKEGLEIKSIKGKQLPVVIRSVIDLDVATYALIFDGAANKKRNGTLFLNRKLAPYQCQIMIEPNDCCLSEMKDLSKHISNVMCRSGLRIFVNDDFTTEHENADQLGIPYTIFVNSDSLNTGLLKLRSRDTTLKETIHISDIPNYLLSIFCAS